MDTTIDAIAATIPSDLPVMMFKGSRNSHKTSMLRLAAAQLGTPIINLPCSPAGLSDLLDPK